MVQKPYDRLIPYNNLPGLPPRKDILDTELLLKWGMAWNLVYQGRWSGVFL